MANKISLGEEKNILNPTKRTGNLWVAFLLFGLGIFAILESLKMPPGLYNTPGPGFYPRLLGVILCGVSLTLVFLSLPRWKNDDRVLLGNWNIWAVLLALFIVAELLERIGFILAFTLFLFFLFKKLSERNWIWCLVFSFSGSMGAYLFFSVLLGLRLPPLYIFE